jgi:retron-type reverse transcriptase
MKTFKNLFNLIISFENLWCAAHRAAAGKREKRNVLKFFDKLEENVLQLQQELNDRVYRPGNYVTFNIYDPKPRLISAAPFRDRVVHHALMHAIEPLFERSFIFDSYANRTGKGTHSAIQRYQYFLRRYDYVLKCDVKKYFPSIDHEILKALIRRTIADARGRWLMDLIIDSSNEQEFVADVFRGDDLLTAIQRRKGLPIGNLTSQFLANVYLNPLDHFVKQRLLCHGYVRYVDDFALFSDSKRGLWHWKEKMERFLDDYRLKLNPGRCFVSRRSHANPFLGQKVFASHRLLCSKTVRKMKKRLRIWEDAPPQNMQQRIAAWRGHAEQADAYCLLKSLGIKV